MLTLLSFKRAEMCGEYEWKNDCSWIYTAVATGLHSSVAKHTSLVEDGFLHGVPFSAKKTEEIHLSTLFYSHHRNRGVEELSRCEMGEQANCKGEAKCTP